MFGFGVAEEAGKLAQHVARRLHRFRAVLDRDAIVRQQAEHAELVRTIRTEQLADADRVLERFGHFVRLALEMELAGVQPLTVPFVLGRFEVNRPVGGAVGETFLNERLHEADYRGNVVGDAQLYIRCTNVQPLQVAPKLVLVPACQLLPVDLLLQCTGDYFVVNVRDVHRGDEREVEVMSKNALHNVQPHVAAGVTDVGRIVHRGAAGVEGKVRFAGVDL
uniref:Uncharacterized protein n=1 Tax=Anopheles coluzzii TaxID=1518534 RepID=A0A8W7PIK3_ANOCL